MTTAGTSWRPFSEGEWWKAADVVIGSDGRGSGGRASYSVYVDGWEKVSRPTLREAREWAEVTLGPLTWSQQRLEAVPPTPGSYTETIWGDSTDFSTPRTIWTAALP